MLTQEGDFGVINTSTCLTFDFNGVGLRVEHQFVSIEHPDMPLLTDEQVQKRLGPDAQAERELEGMSKA